MVVGDEPLEGREAVAAKPWGGAVYGPQLAWAVRKLAQAGCARVRRRRPAPAYSAPMMPTPLPPCGPSVPRQE